MKNLSLFPKSDHFDGELFFNPWMSNNLKGFLDVMKWKISTTPREWPENEVVNVTRPIILGNDKISGVHITFIGHATTFIQDGNHNILTDPHFSSRAGPLSFVGPRRIRKPALEISQLPAVDIVLISHNHYDHLDLPTLIALEKKFQPLFVVPLGNAALLKKHGLKKVAELDWWESVGDVQLVPAQHWSVRGVGDRNKALWGGYVVQLKGRRIFFAGDTGYGPHFKKIRDKCGVIDLAILPIGAYEPRWFMQDQHMNPEDATKAHLDLEAKKSYAIHFETFRLTDEAFLEPRVHLQEALEKYQLNNEDFFVPQVGETLLIE